MLRTYLVVTAMLVALQSSGAQWIPSLRTRADTALAERILKAEYGRAYAPGVLQTFEEGLRSANPDVRIFAARAMGRLETTADLSLSPVLADPVPAVRLAAANAIVQAGASNAAAALRDRLATERDPSVRGMIAEGLGRVRQVGDSNRVALDAFLAAARTSEEIRGGIRGASRMTGALPAPLVDRLRELTTYRVNERPGTPAGDTAAYIRATALARLGNLALSDRAAAPTAADRWLADPAERVRASIVAIVGAVFVAGQIDSTFARQFLARALRDPSPAVRFAAVGPVDRAASRWAADGRCEALRAGARDADATVAITALRRCADATSIALMDSLAGSLPAANDGRWHRASHAINALATAAPDRARQLLPRAEGHPSQFVRMRVVATARTLNDTDVVRRLTRDTTSNVASAAITALAAMVGRGAEAEYVTALRWTDSQVLMAATAALIGGGGRGGAPSPPRAPDSRAAAAILASLDRVTALKRETSRDGRVALLGALDVLGDSSLTPLLRPYLADIDPSVAAAAAGLIAKWTGTRPAVAPRAPARPVPTLAEMAALARNRVTIEMADGGVVELKLYAFEAPTNVARFVRLARAGALNGLTFHRVVPAFVTQGGSPNANEYSGDGPFTHDEVGLENRRGSVGLSTRGHDTGDGQFYFNLIDNIRLDHQYTVFAEVVRGLDVVDRMQEGAVMRRVTVR
jgi:cyclophilin family peptidyl-prolyl cis-trans isomerase/HEAT repeat protein